MSTKIYKKKKGHKPYWTKSERKEDIKKLKSEPVKLFNYLYPNLEMTKQQKDALTFLCNNKELARRKVNDSNVFIAFIAKFVVHNL